MHAQLSTKTIGLLAYDDMQALDLVDPLDVFGAGNAFAPYRLRVIGLSTQTVHAGNGLAVVPEHTLEDAPPLDTLLILGGMAARHGIIGDPDRRVRGPDAHHVHHYHPGTNFGVTTPLWDVLLGTRYVRQARVG
jgi:hypothetical protein